MNQKLTLSVVWTQSCTVEHMSWLRSMCHLGRLVKRCTPVPYAPWDRAASIHNSITVAVLDLEWPLISVDVSDLQKEALFPQDKIPVPAAKAICCRLKLPRQVPQDGGAQLPKGTVPKAIISVGCHKSSTTGGRSMQCESTASGSNSFVAGFLGGLPILGGRVHSDWLPVTGFCCLVWWVCCFPDTCCAAAFVLLCLIIANGFSSCQIQESLPILHNTSILSMGQSAALPCWSCLLEMPGSSSAATVSQVTTSSVGGEQLTGSCGDFWMWGE